MNIMNRVTWQTMKKNRVRTVVTIIGIILSTAMFTAVTTIVSSLLGYFREAEIYESGDYHVHAFALGGEAAAVASSDERVEKTSLLENIGYAQVDSINPDKPYVCIFAADDTFFASMPVRLTEGRLPLADNEVILPAHLESNGGVSARIGDIVEYRVGKRVGLAEFAKVRFTQNHAYQYENEMLEEEIAKSFAVVGFYERPGFEPFIAPGYTVLTKLNGGIAGGSYDCFFRFNDPKKDMLAFERDYLLPDQSFEEHTGLLTVEGYSQYDNINTVVTSFAVILFVLIFVGSVSLIYSAFSISVSERTKQFGLLSSIGATKKQIGRSVLTEALTLSVIGIPLGILAGIGGIAVTLFLLRDSFMGFIAGAQLPMHVSVSLSGVLIAAATAFLTVLVSAWIPSQRAMRISPIEAIRQSRDFRAKDKTGKRSYSKTFIRLFGAEGMLANKYYVRSRKKYRATIISLAMSVILFVAASGFCLYITRSINSVDNRSTFDVVFSGVERDDFERIRNEVDDRVEDLTAYVLRTGDESELYAYIPDADMTAEYKAFVKMIHDDGEAVFYSSNVSVSYMDDTAFRRLLEKYGLNENDYYGEDGKAIMVNHKSVPIYTKTTRENYVFDFVKKGTSSIMLAKPFSAPPENCFADVYWTGDRYGEGELRVYFTEPGREYEYDSKTRPIGAETQLLEFEEVRLGALIDTAQTGMQSGGEWIDLIYPMSAYKGESELVSMYFHSDNTEKAIEDVKEIMNSAGISVSDRSYFDMTENDRLMNNIVTIIKVFSYGFIALISLISVANVFNTVTTNVALRRRDYAMLRSMGMTKKGMNRMTNYECLIYGSRSLLIGLPIAIGVTYLIHLAANDAAHMRFELPWTAIVIAVLSVFTVVFVSMLYSTGKLKKDNPIDALKDENI